MVVIRRIVPDDADRLRQVRLAALHESPSAFGSTYADELRLSHQEWSERAAAGSSGFRRAMFMAAASGDVVGLVGGFRPDLSLAVVELISLWTAPAVRRQGAGCLLVNAVLDWARAGGAEVVSLWVTSGNLPAQNLYRALGFVETGDSQPLPSDPSRPEVRMTLVLPGVAGQKGAAPDSRRVTGSE
jgi:ribosomal protein S18 acetylase RimI-like enzyme